METDADTLSTTGMRNCFRSNGSGGGRPMSALMMLALILTGCSSGDRTLSRTDIELVAGDLRSFGAATKMLVETCSSGDATETFCREQAELLFGHIEDSLEQLAGASTDAEYERKQLEDIGTRLGGIVLRVEQRTADPTDAADADRISSISKTLEDGLRK